MRQCPTFGGDVRPLITHQIRVPLCMERQRGFYHKCHRCAYRGKAATFALDDPTEQDRDPASPARLVKPTADS